MDNKFISEFEQALKAEFDQKKKDLESEYIRRLNAFKVACGDSGHASPIPTVIDRLAPRPSSSRIAPRFYGGGEAIPNGRPSMLNAVKEALKQVDGEFTVRDLVPKIKEIYPNLEVETADLSNPLWTLSEAEEIKRVKSGEGRNPHTYVKAK